MIGELNLTHLDTGETISLGEVTNLSFETPISAEAKTPITMTATKEINFAVDGDVNLAALVKNEPVKFEVEYPYWKQNRTHKKRRINKKWAKRYGYSLAFKSIPVDEAIFAPTSFGNDRWVTEIRLNPDKMFEYFKEARKNACEI